MKFDDVDVSIIYYLFDNKNQTSSDIAKKLFECKTKKDLNNQDSLIRHRIKNLEKVGVILCSPTVPKTYNINPEFVFCGEGTLDIKVNGGKKIEIEFGHFLVITDSRDYIYMNRILRQGEEDKIAEIIT